MSSKKLLFLGFSCLVFPVAAQIIVPAPVPATAGKKPDLELSKEAALAVKMRDINQVSSNNTDVIAFDSRARALRGTPYLILAWTVGDVQLITAANVVPGRLKFDLYNQEVRALRPQGDSIVLTSAQVTAFTLRPPGPTGSPLERHFERLPTGAVPVLAVAYAECLSLGNEVRLLKFQQKIIAKGGTQSSYNSNGPVDFFQTREQYFLRWADGSCVAVKPNRTSILAAVALRQPTAVAAEAQTKPKPQTDEELAAMVQHINSTLTH